MSRNAKSKGLCPPNRALKLDTLANVRTEMARMYRLALKEVIAPDVATKFTYILKEIRCAVEAETMVRLEERLVELSEKVEAAHGR